MDEMKDFSSVSPSAKSLLLMKGYTNIPFAKQTAALMQGPEVFGLSFDDKDFGFWLRVLHFENRYWSIDQLLGQTGLNNILELSSGYSLRGLDLCMRNDTVHYIDTDLPEVIAIKQQLIERLGLDNKTSKFELVPLNAMDETAFNKVVERFDTSAITILNEGLLMYLNMDEKKHLCKTIYGILKKRGGYWITADVYVKRPMDTQVNFQQSESETAFFQRHNIEENKFDSYAAAEAFFREQGLGLVKAAVPDIQQLSSLPHLIETAPVQLGNTGEQLPKLQETWMLQAI